MQLLYFTGFMALTCTHAMYLHASTPINASTPKHVLNACAPEFRPANLLVPPIGVAGTVTMTEQKIVSPTQRNPKRPLTAMSQEIVFTDLGPDDYERNKSSVYQKHLAMKLGSSTHNSSIDVPIKVFVQFDKEQEDVGCRQQFKKYFDSLSGEDKQTVMAAINAGKQVEYVMDRSSAHVKKNKSGEEYTTYTHTPFSAFIQFPLPQVPIKNFDQLTDFLQKDAAEILELQKDFKRSQALKQTADSEGAVEQYEAFIKKKYGDSIGKSQNPYEIDRDHLLLTSRRRIVTQAVVMQSDAKKDDTPIILSNEQIKELKSIAKRKKRIEHRQKLKTTKENEKQQQILPILQTAGAVDNDYTSSKMGGTEFTSDQIDEILAGSSVSDITKHVAMIGIDDTSSVISSIDDVSTKTAAKRAKKKTKNDGKKAGNAEQDNFLDDLLSSPEYEEARNQRVEKLLEGYERSLENVLVPTNDKPIKSKNQLLQELEKSVQDIFACNREFKAIGSRFSKYVPFDRYTMINNKGHGISTIFNLSRSSGLENAKTQVYADTWRKISPLHIAGNILHEVDTTVDIRVVQQSQLASLQKMRKALGQTHCIPNSMPEDQALAIFNNDLKHLFSDNDKSIRWYEVMGRQVRQYFKEDKINLDVFYVDIAQYIENIESSIDPEKKALLKASLVDFIMRK